ncbi:MAG TPA: PTS sugar transporter subunit IIA [Candidatus Binatia bacterium]|nr:PTS sugar transporter subunit IIA [Candidatus Binatia bacterium]
MRTERVSASPFWAGVRALARLGWKDADGRSEGREVAAPAFKPTTGDARIGDLLRVELVLPAVCADGRDDVIETLAARVAACHPGVDAARLVAAVREREDQMTTALVDGVAIPHARMSGLDRTVAAFARSAAGIPWNSLDGVPTHLIFLLAGPADLPGSYLKTLAGVARLLSGARCRTRLLEAAGEAEMLAVLRDEEDRGLRNARAA